ncbi:uncharacterized protein F5Z01DRAFT_660166 [Emericellopsis atlantica]|uniref:DHHA2 domain-containing protein n=1 Tax=Emericellopsis atlantica TaxID=2614577 RepID=A0A9P7ZJA2_9HYPO|nr:uncharacterized protein F5Z01DRAFT_660166 [Emericellopsis atlantica]KAG9252650.1 hypothetical protein F5Z01DRAFT_660166 [Emericellopsis atlantica]
MSSTPINTKMTSMSLRSFLAKARAALAAPASERSLPLTFVVGNESADIDSLCSAVVLAYLQTSSSSKLHIPLSNLPRPDLALRTEMNAVLGAAQLQPSDLLTLSELPDNLRAEDTTWILVDHNALTGPLQKRFAGRVSGCVDHHAEENVVPKDAVPRVIEPCGSCMSLVVEESKPVWQGLAQEEATKLANLGLAAILTDTINLTAEHKIKPKDKTSAAFLAEKLRGTEYNQTRLFEDIGKLKEDLSELSLRDILRKDYKEWNENGLNLGISSVPQGLAYLLDEKASGRVDGLCGALEEWAKEKGLDVVSIMTTSHPGGEFQRHLLVWARSERGEQGLKKFVDAAEKNLQLEKFANGKLDQGMTRLAWQQKNLAASRKQVAPLLREALQKG